LFEEMPVEDTHEQADTILALTDESGQANVLGEGVLEASAESAVTPEELAQGLAHAQAYEDEQRQEIAAETVDAVMYPSEAPEMVSEPAPEVLAQDESVAQAEPESQEPVVQDAEVKPT
jgi:hypothetical protein